MDILESNFQYLCERWLRLGGSVKVLEDELKRMDMTPERIAEFNAEQTKALAAHGGKKP